MRSHSRASALVILLLVCFQGFGPDGWPAMAGRACTAENQTIADQIGVTRLENQLGPAVPTGQGIALGHVEGQPRDYLPHIGNKVYAHVDFEIHSGPSEGNAHSDVTARMVVGTEGLAPGITRVDCYSAPDWLGPGFLHSGRPIPPLTTPVRLFTHSWISPSGRGLEDVLRRVDYLADTQGVIMVVAVNNRQDTPIPPLLASAYNVISVGQWDGKSSGGYTTIDGAGRCKPEIVAPGAMTSFSTPVVAAVMARLMEEAGRFGVDCGARRPQVLKAVLLAGAEKPLGWHCDPGKPLAEHFGAGYVRFDNSYAILAAGPVLPDTSAGEARIPSVGTVQGQSESQGQALRPDSQSPALRFHLRSRLGWSYALLNPGQTHEYLFNTARPLGEASLVLVWHRRIDGRINNDMWTGRPYWSDRPRLAHLDLSLFVRDDSGKETLTAQSVSVVDNLQHIYLRALPAGRYRIAVTRRDRLDEPWDYALAWRIEAAPPSGVSASQP